MSGIEALSHFFENIRPRYSWSSSESVAGEDSNHTLYAASPAHDGASTDSSSSPPSSPMSDIELARNDRIHYAGTEGECANVEQGEGSIRRVRPRIAVASPDIGTSPNSPSIMSPSEGPSDATTRAHQRNQLRLQESSILLSSSLDDPPPPSPVPTSHLLSEDDGHKQLREKVMEIQQMDLPEKERAQRMHFLMTEKYLASQASSIRRSPSPAPYAVSDGGADNPYRLGPNDASPSYFNEITGVFGCAHYRRGVKIQCSTCSRWYPCRFCHDDVEDHALIRKDTKNMLCMHCGKPQPAQQSCKYCGKWTARYFCDKCKLWDDDPRKTIYHCNDCGICRIGMGLGKDFFHCKKCGVCMSIELEGQHRCIERSTDCDCPICGEYMFTSVMTVVFMNCGHSIHHKCYNEHMKSSYRCPTCARSVLNMETQFRFLDHEIARQPLPDPYRNWHCHISCNDCSAKSDVRFHFLGLKCSNCRSYNTCEVRLIRPEDEANDSSTQPRSLPAHLMPNPDTAATIMGNRGVDGVVTDLASVIREIDMATMTSYTPEQQRLQHQYPLLPIATGIVRRQVSPDADLDEDETEGGGGGGEEEEEDDDDDDCDDSSTCHSDCDALERSVLSHSLSDEEEGDYDDEEDDEYDDDDEEELEGYEVIHLPFHP